MADEFVVVRTCGSLQEAELLKSVLEAEQVHAEIPEEYAAGVQPFYGMMEAGIRLVVAPEDAGRAEEILNATTAPNSL